jgi:hypothetical protein
MDREILSLGAHVGRDYLFVNGAEVDELALARYRYVESASG